MLVGDVNRESERARVCVCERERCVCVYMYVLYTHTHAHTENGTDLKLYMSTLHCAEIHLVPNYNYYSVPLCHTSTVLIYTSFLCV
jgi:hypothetical protein